MSEKWKMVPVVMTDEMTEAARAALDLGEGYVETSCLDLDAAYEAAIRAAPTNPQQDRISAIITRALLEPCDNHKDRAELARETARQVVEAGPRQDDFIAAWDAQADEYNSWCHLSGDERDMIAAIFRAGAAWAQQNTPEDDCERPSYANGLEEGLRRAFAEAARRASEYRIWQGGKDLADEQTRSGIAASFHGLSAEAASLTGLYRKAIQLADAHRRRAEAAEARVKALLELLAKHPAALAQLFPQEPLDADMARIWSENIDRMYER